jgi:hypothetical protein
MSHNVSKRSATAATEKMSSIVNGVTITTIGGATAAEDSIFL